MIDTAKTHFVSGTFVKEILGSKTIYRVDSFYLEPTARWATLILVNVRGDMKMEFPFHKIWYYEEYFPIVEKPRYWREHGQDERLIVDYVLKPIYYFVVDIWTKIRKPKKTPIQWLS